MTTINVQAEYHFDPSMLAISRKPGETFVHEDTEAVAIPTERGVVLSLSGEVPDEMEFGDALTEALTLFDDILEEITFEGDWPNLPDNPTDVRLVNIEALVSDLRIVRGGQEPPEPQLAAA